MLYLEEPEGFSPRMEVASCFLEHEGALLSIRRAPHVPQPNTWAFPGGKLEKGEQPIEAMVREIREEVGLEVDASRLKHFKKVYVRYPDFDFVHHIFHYPLAHSFSTKPEVRLSEEQSDHRWVTPAEALKLDLIPDEDACIKLFYFS